MQVRLQKYLADAGVCARRKAEELILAGRVTVNSVTIRTLGTKVDENDKIAVDNRPVQAEGKIYLCLNKPVQYVTTAKDQFGRPCVLDLIKTKERVFPVGRLDYDTSGLLLLTNDGDLAFRLTHPKHEIPKTYEAIIKGRPTEAAIKTFQAGIDIGGYITRPAKLKILKRMNSESLVQIIISEGKNRQIRKMCNQIGHDIIELKRTSIGQLGLGGLPVGGHRLLSRDEIQYLSGL